MNPLKLHPTKTNASEAAPVSAEELLRQHHYDPRVHDQLLAAAHADFKRKQATEVTANSVAPDPHSGEPSVSPVMPTVSRPVEPPDDTEPNRHREILIVPNFLSTDVCDEYIEYISQQPEIDLSVFDPKTANKTGELAWEVDKQVRDTQTVDLDPIKEPVLDIMRYAVRDFLNPFFNVTIKDSELPQILVYHPGGHYRPHVDGEALFDDGSGQLQWVKNVDRDISLVVYLNDDYEGGEIVFPKQAISVKPRKGMLVAFPSTHHFLHGVNPVVRGHRFAIVNWFSLGGEQPTPPESTAPGWR